MSKEEDYFLFQRGLVQSGLMSRNKALFYQDLCHLESESDPQLNLLENGKVYFLCTVECIHNSGLGWDRNIQQKMLNDLKNDGIITVLYKGHGRKRYIHINSDLVNSFIKNWEITNKKCSDKTKGVKE